MSKRSLASGSGYLQIDHSDSPGIRPEDIPEALRRSTIAVGKGETYEADIQQCTHCQRGVVLRPDRERMRGYCPYCYHYICDDCDKMLRITGQCIPFKKVLDEAANLIEKGDEPLIILTDI